MVGRDAPRSGTLWIALVVLLALCCAVVVAAPTAAAAEPRAEAGVDQDVTRGSTVLVDASESWSPAGELERYEWTVTTPQGDTVAVTCETDDCRLANFRAVAMGTYEVELTVEDEAGQVATDAMYVETEAGNEFDVDLRGPDDSGTVELTADVDAGNATLEHLLWLAGDAVVANESLSGLGDVHERTVDASPGETYTVVVIAADDRSAVDSWTAAGSRWSTFPYIEGPEELTGEASYDAERERYVFRDATYRVVPGPVGRATDVTWIRDGESVATGQTFTPEFYPGEHTLEATLTYEYYDVDFETFDQVGSDVSEQLAGLEDERSAELTVVANPEPQIFNIRPIVEGSAVDLSYEATGPGYVLDSTWVTIDGEIVYRENLDNERSQNRGHSEEISTWIKQPSGVYGKTPIRITVEDSRGETTTQIYHVKFPSRDNNGDNSPRHTPCRGQVC